MTSKAAIVVYGDCQAMVLASGLKRLPEVTDRFEIFHIWPVRPGEQPDSVSPVPSAVWKRCHAFWVQVGTSVPPEHYVAEAPDRRITFSSLYLPFTFPFSCPDAIMRPTPLPARYGHCDPFLVELSEGELTGDAIYYRYEELNQRHLVAIDRALESGSKLMNERDADASVKIAGYAIAHTCERRLMWTAAHPAEAMSAVQLDRMLRVTFPGEVNRGGALFRAGERAFAQPNELSVLQTPVSWTVADYLGLSWWTPYHRYRLDDIGKALTLKEFVVEYVTERRAKLAQQREANAAMGVAAD